MAAPKNASLGPFLTLTKGMRIRIDALDATSGAQVSGVIVSNVALATDQEDTPGPPPPQQPVTLIAGTAA